MPLINPWTIYLGGKALLVVGGYAAKKHMARKARLQEESEQSNPPVAPAPSKPGKATKDRPPQGPVLFEYDDEEK